MQPDTDKDRFILEALRLGKYEVLSDGTIVSHLRNRRKVIKQSVMTDGYCRVGLSIDGKVQYVKAHRVVALALVPNPSGAPIVNHKDGVKSNNHPSNLEWVTAQENSQHAFATGLHQSVFGEDTPAAKLTEEQVRAIRAEYAKGGISQSQLGRRYGIKQNTVSVIVNGVNWKQIAA